MIAFAVTMLLISALFNIVTWPQFFRRVARDPRAHDEQGAPTRFFTVHLILVILALIIAVACIVAAVLLIA